MFGLTITEKYITNIPWDLNPSFCFADDAEKYEEAFTNVLEYVPGTNKLIRFEDDVWDFRPYYADINNSSYVINFSKERQDYIDYLKFFVIYSIGGKTKISTIGRRVSDFIQIITEIQRLTNLSSFSLITTEEIISLIEYRDIENSRKHSLFACTHIIYDFIIKNYRINLPIDVELLKQKSAIYKKKAKESDDKLPNIPEELYNAIINKAVEILDNSLAKYNSRMTAGLIIIASQTGLRTQDLLGIKTDALKEKYLPVSNVKCHYLHYQTRKPSKAHSDMLEFDIYASQLCSETFQKMLVLRNGCKFRKQPYLYILDSANNSKNEFPILSSRFQSCEYKGFMYNYLPEFVTQEWEGVSRTKYIIKHGCEPILISVPTISQFRVHLATSLYNNGVSLTYIQRYLGHLSEYMIGYYVRPKDKSVENAAYAERIIKKISYEDATPLGLMGHELKENLKAFIKEGKYNVATDAHNILADLGEKMVIREKGPGLCCIRTSIIPCKNDARTNELLCAYGLCPNVFHFYDMIDVSYMQFHALQETYQENINNGFTKAAQKELHKLKDFIKRRLFPEVKELEKYIKTYGAETMCNEHPDLSYIIQNILAIKEEIEVWQNY